MKASQIKITKLKKEIEHLGGNTRGRSASPAKREKTVDEGESKVADGGESKTEDDEEQEPSAAESPPPKAAIATPKAAIATTRILVDNGVQMELDHVANGASSVAIPDDASDQSGEDPYVDVSPIDVLEASSLRLMLYSARDMVARLKKRLNSFNAMRDVEKRAFNKVKKKILNEASDLSAEDKVGALYLCLSLYISSLPLSSLLLRFASPLYSQSHKEFT